MARGGYQKPTGGPRPPSGPGKFSQRTDGGNQAARVPQLSGSDLQYGDVSQLRAAQQAAPIPNVPSAGPVSPGGSAPAGGGSPSMVFEGPSSQPDSPVTAGLPMGPGPGPEILPPTSATDVRTLLLSYLASNYDNADAAQMLQDMQSQQAAGNPQPVAPSPPSSQPTDPALPPMPMAGPNTPPPPAPDAPLAVDTTTPPPATAGDQGAAPVPTEGPTPAPAPPPPEGPPTAGPPVPQGPGGDQAPPPPPPQVAGQ